MSNHAGMTCIPQIYTDAEGVEHLSYSHGHVLEHGNRLEVQAEALQDQSEYFSVDNNGEVEHAFDIGELGSDAWVDSIHDGDDYDEDYEDDDDFSVSESIFDELITESNYEVLIEWASDNLSQSSIDEFDDIIEDGSYEDIYNAIERLIDTYNENQSYY